MCNLSKLYKLKNTCMIICIHNIICKIVGVPFFFWLCDAETLEELMMNKFCQFIILEIGLLVLTNKCQL